MSLSRQEYMTCLFVRYLKAISGIFISRDVPLVIRMDVFSDSSFTYGRRTRSTCHSQPLSNGQGNEHTLRVPTVPGKPEKMTVTFPVMEISWKMRGNLEKMRISLVVNTLFGFFNVAE